MSAAVGCVESMVEASQKLRRPALRYHGGKWKLAPWIISHFPAHRIYVEPFGGGASVLLRKPRSYAEVYNDLWADVVNVFRVLRDPVSATELERLLRLTSFARDEFEAPWPDETIDVIERARRTIFRSFAGFGSASTNAKHSTGFRANSNRSGTTPAHDWANFPQHITTFTARLAGVVVENRPAVDVITSHDSAETLHYVDPPYPHETRNMARGNAAYACEMATADHEQLAEVLNSCSGMVIVSSYHSAFYEKLFNGWLRIDCKALADGARDRTESLYLNAACATATSQKRLFA